MAIGPLDTLIAAQAMARGLTLVSNNEREFPNRGAPARELGDLRSRSTAPA